MTPASILAIDDHDLLLLRFVLDDRPESIDSWLEWSSTSHIDDHTSPAYGLFPAAYKKLERLDHEHPWMARLKGVYRRSWTQSQLEAAALDRVLAPLARAGIPVLCPPEEQLARLLEEPGQLPRRRPRLTVPWTSANDALDVLRSDGWKVTPTYDPLRRLRHRLSDFEWLVSDAEGTSAVISDHYHVAHRGRHVDVAIWDRARQASDRPDVPLLMAAPSDLLYALAIDGLPRSRSLRWAAALKLAPIDRSVHITRPGGVSAARTARDVALAARLQLLEEFSGTTYELAEPDPLLRFKGDEPSVARQLVFSATTLAALTTRWGGIRRMAAYANTISPDTLAQRVGVRAFSAAPEPLLGSAPARRIAARRYSARTSDGQSDYRRFVVLCHPRSGSNMLLDALNEHPHLVAHAEIFNEDQPYIAGSDGKRDTGSLWLRAIRQHDPAAFVDTFVFRPYPPEIAAVGFKLFPYQYDNEHFRAHIDQILDDPDLSFVILRRRNKLATVLSQARAAATGRWMALAGGDGASHDSDAPIRLDPVECAIRFRTLIAEDERWRAIADGRPTVTVDYEDLVRDLDGPLREIQTALGLDPRSLRTRTVQQRTGSLRENIVNFDELAQTFEGTEHAPYFDDE